ncbi:hypothetical protein WA026_005616 [Henosepilachna vigintioctopunctata]|uniref:Uncharacterized protein n=1 Tax=Henosepilachna vigintioctopunctata TaxID=420089 RepID=A0AAW1TWZ5_9CUCU
MRNKNRNRRRKRANECEGMCLKSHSVKKNLIQVVNKSNCQSKESMVVQHVDPGEDIVINMQKEKTCMSRFPLLSFNVYGQPFK